MSLFRFSMTAALAAAFISGVWGQAEPPEGFAVTDETVVATLNGKDLTAKDVEKLRAGLPDQMRRSMQGMDHKAFLSAYANMVALAKAAEEEGFDKKEPYAQQLEYLRMQFLGEVFMTRYNATLVVSDEIKQDFYNMNQKAYEVVSASAIYVDFSSAGTGTRSEEEARTLATKLVEELRGGADFAMLASKHSDDTDSAEKGGLLGDFDSDSELPPNLLNTILALESGEVSQPVRDNARYYIFKANQRTPRPFGDMAPDVEKRLRGLMFRRKLADVRDSVELEYKNEEFLSRRPFAGASQTQPD